MKTLAIIIVGAALASSAWAADLTVAIEEGGTGPLGQWYLDYEMRKHIRHLDTIQAISEAKEVGILPTSIGIFPALWPALSLNWAITGAIRNAGSRPIVATS